MFVGRSCISDQTDSGIGSNPLKNSMGMKGLGLSAKELQVSRPTSAAEGVNVRDVNKDLTPKDQDKNKELTPKDQDMDKDLTPKDQDKDKDLTLKDKDKDKDLTPKDQDKDKDLKYVLKDKDEDKDHS